MKTSLRPYFYSNQQCWQQVVRVVLALVVATVVAGFLSLGNQAQWVILATVLLLPTSIGYSQQQRVVSILIAGLSAALLVYIVALIEHPWWFQAIVVAVVVWAGIYWSGVSHGSPI